jgi:hypothetical protein
MRLSSEDERAAMVVRSSPSTTWKSKVPSRLG